MIPNGNIFGHAATESDNIDVAVRGDSFDLVRIAEVSNLFTVRRECIVSAARRRIRRGVEIAGGDLSGNTAFARDHKYMCALNVAPFVPVFKEQPLSDVRFYFALFSLFVFSLVTFVVLASGVNLRRKRHPFAVRRPNRPTGAGGNLSYLFLVIAIVIHNPDLASRNVSYLLPIRRPAWRRGGFIAAGHRLGISTRNRNDVDLVDHAIAIEVYVANREGPAHALRRYSRIGNPAHLEKVFNGKRSILLGDH